MLFSKDSIDSEKENDVKQELLMQVDVSQQESERIRLRRELDEARNQSDAALTSQQGKLSDIMTGGSRDQLYRFRVQTALFKGPTSCSETTWAS